ncbi:MAG: UDP-N-acetylglucosamine 1-carboxyvinyltransferase [Chthonomonadaceae bacterium]|nr:UDP-N-acetylglucosamine 1-carboxyvinyltransferase [Chthonomonadaceae bacterium]
MKLRGGQPLHGSVSVPGSKNAALAILSSVVLADGPIVLHNVPEVSDVVIKVGLLRQFGCDVEWREGSLFIDCSNLKFWRADDESMRPIRTGFYLLGPMLAKIGEADIPMPGGCKIGARPVDYHLKGLSIMGASIKLDAGRYVASAPHLHGGEVHFEVPSAGATQHLMATATRIEGTFTISNAAMEPEVVALAQFLTSMGAKIEGAGTSTITVTGVTSLNGTEFRIPEDRLQAGTYMLAGAVTKGDVTVTNVLPEPQTALVSKMREAGIDIEEGHDWIRVRATSRPKAVTIKTMPYPGFPTDIQQPMSAILTLASGQSLIEETLYESRIGHVEELKRMGADMSTRGRMTVINGVSKLKGAVVEASDLRAGAALCLAGLAAEGETLVKNVHFIDRGYEGLEARLTSLGAAIERMGIDEWDEVQAKSKLV